MGYLDKLTNYARQSNPCYEVGDIGPGGGIVFSVPGLGVNQTNFYFEAAPVDVSVTQRNSATGTTGPSAPAGTCTNIPPQAEYGAEFGVVGVAIPPGDNGMNIGDGLPNTAYLNSYPTSSGGFSGTPINPVLDTHDLAAHLCADYIGPNGHTDWFLPSMDEATELMLNIGPPSPLGNAAHLETSNSNPASNFYWTSSVISPSIGSFDEVALGFKTSAQGGPFIMYRCTTGSVRPVRMFECPVAPPGVKYNYRYWRGGSGVTDIGAMALYGRTNAPPYGPIHFHEIGHPYMSFKFNKRTAVLNHLGGSGSGNLYLSWSQILQMYPFVPSSTMYSNQVLISVWNKHEVLLGQWKYEFTGSGSTCGVYGNCHAMPRLEFISHVAGPSILDIPNDSYIKIEHESGLYGNDPAYFADSADLSNYANTGTNIRMINSTTGAPISGNPGYWYICVSHCGGYANGCHRWKASLPPPAGNYLGPLSPSSGCCTGSVTGGGTSAKLLNPNEICPGELNELNDEDIGEGLDEDIGSILEQQIEDLKKWDI